MFRLMVDIAYLGLMKGVEETEFCVRGWIMNNFFMLMHCEPCIAYLLATKDGHFKTPTLSRKP